MKRIEVVRALAFVAWMAFAHGAEAAVDPISTALVVQPAQPTTDDSIRVTETTVYPMICWQDLATTCGAPAGDTLTIATQVQYCHGGTSCLCLAAYDSHTRTCTFPPLPAGAYTVVFRDEHVNPADRMASFVRVAHFTVDAVTPASCGSWGKLKLHYR